MLRLVDKASPLASKNWWTCWYLLQQATNRPLTCWSAMRPVGLLAVGPTKVSGKERQPLPDPRRWSRLIKERMVHRILKCCADCTWAGVVYDQQKAEADKFRRRSHAQAAQTNFRLKMVPHRLLNMARMDSEQVLTPAV